MKKKYKVSDVTKFTIALGLCLSLILVSIVLVNVFTHQDKSAKAESVAEREIIGFSQYSLPLNEWSASGSMYVSSSSESYINFTALAQYDSLRTPRNFTFKANNKYLLSFYLESSGVPNGTLQISVNNEVREIGYFLEPFEIANCVGNKRLFTYIFTPVEVGGSSMMIIYDNSTYGFVNYELSFLNLFNMSDIFGVGYEPTTSDEFFRYIASNQNYPFYKDLNIDPSIGLYDQLFSDSAYNKGYNQALTDVGAFNTYDRDNIIIDWYNSQNFPTLRFSSNSYGGYDIYAYGAGITPSLGMSFTFDVPLYKGVTYELNYNIASNAGFTPNESFAYYNVGFGVIYGSNTNLLTESPLTGDPFIGISERFNILNGYSFTPSRDYDKCQFVVIIGYVGGTANTESYLFSVNDITLTSILTYKDGYDKGFADGSSGSSSIVDPNSASYKRGYSDGDSAGYDRGYSVGVQNQYSFATLFTAVIEAPINAVLNGFNVEILGMNLRNFYLSLFSLAIVIVVIKLILFRRN